MEEDFRLYLNFKNDDTGRVEIIEPVGFDGASFVLLQEKSRYGRDVSYGNEEVSLTFYDGVYSFGDLTMGFDHILRYFKKFGFESEIEFIISKSGLDFVTGILDIQFAKTDLLTYIDCKVIQQTNKAIINRRKDVKVDVFSNKDCDLNAITPVATSNILLKAKPVRGTSKWEVPEEFGIALVADTWHYYNPAQMVIKDGISSTLTSFLSVESGNDDGTNVLANNFNILKADEDLSDVAVNITNFKYIFDHIAGAADRSVLTQFILSWGYTPVDPIGSHQFFSFFTTDTDYVNENDFTYTIPFVPRDARVFLYFKTSTAANFSNQIVLIPRMNVEVIATSTAIDSVIKGVRYIDLIKQNIKSISKLPVNSSRFDIGGEFYDQFAFNGKLIRQIKDKPFYVQFKDLMSGLQEVNSDFQIDDAEVFINKYDDFYPNKDLGGFLQAVAKYFSQCCIFLLIEYRKFANLLPFRIFSIRSNSWFVRFTY